MQLSVNLKEKSYDIIIEHGVLNRIGNFADLNRKVLIISDTGVPMEYVNTVMKQCPQGYYHIVQQGEGGILRACLFDQDALGRAGGTGIFVKLNFQAGNSAARGGVIHPSGCTVCVGNLLLLHRVGKRACHGIRIGFKDGTQFGFVECDFALI